MNYITHNDLWWIAFLMPSWIFQPWVEKAGWDDEFADGPLDAPEYV